MRTRWDTQLESANYQRDALLRFLNVQSSALGLEYHLFLQASFENLRRLNLVSRRNILLILLVLTFLDVLFDHLLLSIPLILPRVFAVSRDLDFETLFLIRDIDTLIESWHVLVEELFGENLVNVLGGRD